MNGDAAPSLRRRLLGFLLLAILLASVVQAVSAYRGALRQADAMFDYHLQQIARALRSGLPILPPIADGAADGFDYFVQIWGPNGAPIFSSAPKALPPRAVLGFSDVTVDGTQYRVYSLQTPLQTVQIAQNMSARLARARTLAAHAVLPTALMAPLLMLVVWWVVRRSLAPVERTRRQVAGRGADDLSPLPGAGLPAEVRPLVDEFNLLLSRVHASLDAQSQFVANAAHELRSPLTALKLQAQALRRGGADDAAREAAMARLNQGIDRAIRLVEQLLVLAREEAGSDHPGTGERMNLQDVVQFAVADMLAQAQARRIDLGVADSAPAWVLGQPEALRILLRNLLDNALKYTPAGGRVDVALRSADAQALLVVEDSGPGIAPADRAQVFERFFRADHDAKVVGSGLGLAIVKTIAERHHAALELGSSERLGGLKVEVRFALAPAAEAG